ncbi:MAG TPA: ribosome recycling factor [Capillibacterium sp.]
MQKVIEVAKKDFATIRTGRANPAILDRVTVECYGSMMPLNQVANISAPEPRMIVVQPWDKSILASVERAILKADLGLNPTNDGNVIRLVIPQLTEERRRELVKLLKKDAEEKRVAIRNVRRDANDTIKKMEKDGTITEDESKKGIDDIQKLTDKYIAEIDKLAANKEQEIMEV